MSTQQLERDRVIVLHPPITGDDRVAEFERANQAVKTIYLPEAEVVAPAFVPQPAAVAGLDTAPAKTRAFGLDAYRGFFLLAMTFAMTIPLREGLFPGWMYHMQYPATGEFLPDRNGVTWRDLLFPAFLFTMCAAIPITNTARLRKGMPFPAIIWGTVKRFAMLYVFALIIGHTLPYWTQDYSKTGNLIAIAGFIACWPVFMRKPATMSDELYSRLKILGWALTAVVLFALPLLDGTTFSLMRKDGIIHALAVVSLIVTPLWLFTRTRPWVRLGVLGAIVAVKILTDLKLPGGTLFYEIEKPVLYEAWMFELLIVGIPATFAGDRLIRWMRSDADEVASWGPARLLALSLACLAPIVVVLVGYYINAIPQAAFAMTAVAAVMIALTLGARTEKEKVLAWLTRAAAVTLVAGALIVPVGGGIRKDPQTISYLIVTAGLSMALLVIALTVVDVFKRPKPVTRLLVDVGQNPLLAYVAFTMFFNNIAWLTMLGGWHSASPMRAVIGGLVFTALTAALAALATRRKIYWRT